MLVIPAIDLHNGDAVRLYKGDFSKVNVYSQNPAELAARFEGMGAKYLHIVDLDGAKSGAAVNAETIRRIRERSSIPIQVGGGIRSRETASVYLEELRINRVILGTIAVDNPAFVRLMIDEFGADKIVVSVDVRDGKVSKSGWTSDSAVEYPEFIERLTRIGVRIFVVTDISRDGTLTSPNWSIYERISSVSAADAIKIIVSGGVSCDEDVEKARKYYGVIVGKAYYEGKVDLEKCLKNV